MNSPQQSEFPLRVAICAWCKPGNGGAELGGSLGAISHGICPRHLKQMQRELQRLKAEATAKSISVRRWRRRGVILHHPEFSYPV